MYGNVIQVDYYVCKCNMEDCYVFVNVIWKRLMYVNVIQEDYYVCECNMEDCYVCTEEYYVCKYIWRKSTIFVNVIYYVREWKTIMQ